MRQPKLLSPAEVGESPAFLQDQLITYIGNKRALLPFIGNAVRTVQQRTGKSQLNILDLFSGTGIVSRYLKQFSKTLHVNDLESYSRVTNECYLSNISSLDINLLENTITHLENEIIKNLTAGFICDLYAPKDEANITPDDRAFYTRRNASYLDTARVSIAKLPTEIQKYLLAPLIAKASVHANTSGVFKGFYKNTNGIGQFGGTGKDALQRILGEIKIPLPVFSRFECEITIHQQDANSLVKSIQEVDLAYFDPPYNQHPYGSNYFMLNLLVDYKRPEETSKVSGIPIDWNRSRYNQRAEAANALFDAVESCPARFILISYNSEGFINHEQFMTRLNRLGTVEVCETQYNTFRGSRNLRNRATHVTEFLYLLQKT